MEPTIHAVQAQDGHQFQVIAIVPPNPSSRLVWMSAMGVAARNYIALATLLAKQGIAVFLHEWRGIGSSSLRADQGNDWGYREIIELDVPETLRIAEQLAPNVPTRMGGHSLGGQLASCIAGLRPAACTAGVWLVCSGSPYWRRFDFPNDLGVLSAYIVFPLVGRIRGYFPGRKLKFAGNEAAGMMRDWSRTALTGKYKVRSMSHNFDALMAQIDSPVVGIVTIQDWLAPVSSMKFLQGKFIRSPKHLEVLDGLDLGYSADHFTWMANPEPIARRLLRYA